MKEIYCQEFKEDATNVISFKLLSDKNKPYSREIKYISIFVNYKQILRSKPINIRLEKRFYNADNIAEMLYAFSGEGKIKKEDEKTFNLLKSLYY